MNKKTFPVLDAEAILKFRNALESWFITFHRKLPWRETNDPYSIWVSEVMLQQTQVAKVIDYYLAFIEAFPTVAALAEASQEQVLKVWEGLGYYSRARNLHRAAQVVMNIHAGVIPADYNTFLLLPGVGGYIAAAVMSQAFDLPFAVVDGNVKRVIARLFAIEEPINKSPAQKIIHTFMNSLLDPEHAGMFNQAMMELGAVVCRPQQPLCKDCPVQQWCSAFRYRETERFPVVTTAKTSPEYHIVAGIIYRNDTFLIVRRPEKGLLGGLWEFPGGRYESDENAEEACVRTIHQKTGLTVSVISHFSRIRHAYSHFKIVMDVYRCQYESGTIRLSYHEGYNWIVPDDLNFFPFHKAVHKFLPLLKENMLL